MIEITSGTFTDIGVSFAFYTPNGSKVEIKIDVDAAKINIPSTGSLPEYAIDEFNAAVKLAKQLSKREIAVNIKRLTQRFPDADMAQA
jgi:ribosome-associated translation inhibitor RaiA